MLYKYETHCHTKQTSLCSCITGKEIAQFYKQNGYTGIFITDHFLNGNVNIPRELPWEEKIARYAAGYDDAKAEGDRIGLDVLFAWEYSWGGNDFLIYGLDRDWLLAHPQQMELHPREYMEKVRTDGGLVIHAHPFRQAGYIESIRLVPSWVDGIEVINASRSPEDNRRADWYADSYGLLKSAGSDNHSGKRPTLAGVYLPERLTCEKDFVRLMKAGVHEIFMDRYDDSGVRL